MNRQLKLYFYLNALCACVFAFPSENSLNLAEKNSNNAKSHRLSGFKGEHMKESDIITNTDVMKVEKPVNQRYPHAVLYGTTCGGTIISPTWILTAAHCSIGNKGYYVLAGTNNSESGNGIVRLIKRRIIHPRFAIGPYWLNAEEYNIKQVAARYDFLLAELEEPLPFDNINVAPAKLNENYILAPKTKVGYAGYGTTHHGGHMSAEMHEMKLELLPEDECSTLKEYDSQDMICAKGGPPTYDSACGGDSGSGLVDENGVLVGVISWGEGDKIECRKGAIIYFAKIAEARDWIREVTNV